MRARGAMGPSADLAVGVAQAGLGFLVAGLGPCLVLLARDLSVPLGALSWLSAGFGAGLLILGIVGARLLRAGSERVLAGSAACLGAGAILLAAASGIPLARAGALLLGVGGAGVVLAGWALLCGPDAARRLTYVNATASLSGVAAPLLMGLVDALTGNGRLALLLAVPPLLWLAWAAWRAPGPSGGSPAAPASSDAPRPALRHVVGRWIAVVTAVSAEFAFVVWGAARLQESGLSPSAAAAGAVAFPVGMGAGRLVAPRLGRPAPVVLAGAALGVAGALLAVAPSPPALVLAALAAAGLGIAPLFPLMLARFMATPGLGARRGSSIGTAASGVAVLGAPLLLDGVAARTSLRTGFLVAVVALVLLLLLQLQRGRTLSANAPR